MISQEDVNRMIAEGNWVYNPETARVINIETGETLDTLEWLVKEIEAKNMGTTERIRISTATCPSCGHKPIPVIEGKPTICPVCSITFGGKNGK